MTLENTEVERSVCRVHKKLGRRMAVYRVTGKIRLQADGNRVHQRNKAVGGLGTTSFEEWRGAEPMRWGSH